MTVLSDPTTIVETVRSVPHLLAAIPLDDNTVSVLAMLIGIAGGWTLTGFHQQMKAKRVKIESEKRQARARKPE
jgi:SRSO17 transposase